VVTDGVAVVAAESTPESTPERAAAVEDAAQQGWWAAMRARTAR
jgi:hypothetical protein